MKLSEMNANQKVAARCAWDAVGWVVGGYENCLTDYEEGSEEYEDARRSLADHEALVDEIYDETMSKEQFYGHQLRFAGKNFILARIEGRLKSFGY